MALAIPEGVGLDGLGAHAFIKGTKRASGHNTDLLTFCFGIVGGMLLGAITDAMTSTPSLNVITQAAKSTISALDYAGTYTFANVFLALAGTVLVYL